MGVLQIIAAVLLIISCLLIILVVLAQDTKQGMSQTISGASADNYYQKNSSRTKEAKLSRLTKIAAVVFFVVCLAVNIIAVVESGSTSDSSDDTAAITTTAADTTVADTTVADDAAAEDTTAADTTTATE